MCLAEHHYYVCPCRNVDCKTPHETCCHNYPPPQGLLSDRWGHYLPTCDCEVIPCDTWVLDRLDPKASLVAEKCQMFEEAAVVMEVELCSTCKKNCANKQSTAPKPPNSTGESDKSKKDGSKPSKSIPQDGKKPRLLIE